ncbi:protein PTST homolog 2, chloroplastic-like isoform X2 [Populus nigra]|uniref:protein PTST homolog 2, chloroplastic-like isoform X2 n=1 Tax=Populus nigra TaxID=3691 RepID=UPI002B264757|nr:protein PTST homolog 2, chloroplastic-like isoform X2 [Populus nigra]
MLHSITHAPNYSVDLIPRVFLPSMQLEATSNSHNLLRKGKVSNQELRFLAVKETSGFLELKRSWWGSGGGFVRRCNRRDWESCGSDIALETEILEFMKNSENPLMFPSKKQLIDAGRMDLVDAILKEGGWLALGWDFDDNADDADVVDCYSSLTDNKECSTAEIQDKALEYNKGQSSQVSCSSSSISLETATEDDAGIGGILYRLEKERNMNLGFALKEIESTTRVQSSDINHDWLPKTTKNETVAGLNANNIPGLLNPNSGVINDLGGELDHSTSFSNTDGSGNSLNPDTWRIWSIKRAGFSDMQFEGSEENVLGDEILDTKEGSSETVSRSQENCSDGGINQNQVRSRLRDLELELSSVLQALKSNTSETVSQKVDNGSSSGDLLKLSDSWEFQENEIMNAQDKLRSIRAKLAVLEGKMALAISDAQKFVEEKLKRIDDASRALQLLRAACIVWPSSASEVLLSGSFDGWATQRRMQKSSVGIFSLYLKLYPGRYEIKFVVDGEWKIDPLRPIVNNNGYENNLLIIK